MKRIFDIIVISALGFTLAACGSTSGGGGSSGSPAVGTTQAVKKIYSKWTTGDVTSPAIYLGFNTQALDPQNMAVVYIDLTNAQIGQINLSIGPGINSLFCHFTGSLDNSTINLTSVVADSQQHTNTVDALLIQQNLQTYCSSLVDIWSYSLNNNQLDMCSLSQGCYTLK